MRSAIVFGLLLAGASAQTLVAVQSGADCVGQTSPMQWQYCGSLATNNIFWNYSEVDQALTVLVEGADNAWRAVGFSPSPADAIMAPMSNAQSVVSCQDFNDTVLVLDTPLNARNAAALLPQLGAGEQELANTVVNRTNGVCGFRFTRPAAPAAFAVDDLTLTIRENVANVVVSAWGPSQDMFMQHAAGGMSRSAAAVDFRAGTAEGLGMVMQLQTGVPPTPMMTNPDGMDNNDNAPAATLQISSAVVAGAMSVLATLW